MGVERELGLVAAAAPLVYVWSRISGVTGVYTSPSGENVADGLVVESWDVASASAAWTLLPCMWCGGHALALSLTTVVARNARTAVQVLNTWIVDAAGTGEAGDLE